MTRTIDNFGRNIRFQPRNYFRPESSEEVLQILADHQGQQFRAIGSLHSWSRAQETDGVVIDMSLLVSIDIETKSINGPQVTVGGGCQVRHLLKALSMKGLTLPSVGLIDKQTVSGATATGTHGSGKHSLSHYIRAVTIAHFDSDGMPQLTRVSEGKELEAARCSLGLMGIIVSITFECREKYNINEMAAAFEHVDDVLAEEAKYPLQQFYLLPWSWRIFAHHRRETVENKSKLAGLYRWYFFLAIDLGLHIAVCGLARFLKSRWLTSSFFKFVVPLTIARKWSVVDDSHKMLVMEHDLFRHCEVEVFVQRRHVVAATNLLIDIVSVFGDQQLPDTRLASQNETKTALEQMGRLDSLEQQRGSYCHHYPICFRRVLVDDTLISMACPSVEQKSVSGISASPNEDWFSISFISYQSPNDRAGFLAFAKFISSVVAEKFGGRCHWGKLNSLDKAENRRLYPHLETFKEVVHKFDPNESFSNEWLKQVI